MDLIPEICVWELTLACNTACVHCGSSAGKPRPEELSAAEALHLCDALAALGSRTVTLSGGEPLLRRDWRAIAARLVARGVRVDMISNGIALGRDEARAIAVAGLSSVTLSVDGPELVHDHLRGRPRGFRRALEAAAHLRDEGVRLGAATQVNQWNLGVLPDLENILADAGFEGWQLQLTMPTGRVEGRDDLVLRPSQVHDVIDFIVACRARGRMRVYASDNIGWMLSCEPEIRSLERPANRVFPGCGAGLSVVGITSAGNIRGCLSLPPTFDEGNVRARSLGDIWRDENAFAYNRGSGKSDLTGPCAPCPFRRVCRGGCTCLAHTTGNTIRENAYCTRVAPRTEADRNAS